MARCPHLQVGCLTGHRCVLCLLSEVRPLGDPSGAGGSFDPINVAKSLSRLAALFDSDFPKSPTLSQLCRQRARGSSRQQSHGHRPSLHSCSQAPTSRGAPHRAVIGGPGCTSPSRMCPSLPLWSGSCPTRATVTLRRCPSLTGTPGTNSVAGASLWPP